jgi:signal transduction histidine kinase
MSFPKAFAKQPRGWILAEMVLAVCVIGFLDFTTGYQVRLLPLYCAPIFVAAWFGGRRLAICIGLVAGMISLGADWLDHDPDLEGWVRPWEIARHIGSCLTVALVAAALRTKSDVAAARIRLLEHSQRLEREIVSISEAEQRRIGQDLHDGICQHLAALSCAATSLRNDLRDLRLKGEAALAADLAAHLREAVVQTRDLSHGLAPAHVSQVGLAMALESLAHNVSRLQEVNCSFQSRGQLAHCDERTAIHLYRITQEAINNATRHGHARNVEISLAIERDRLTLRIKDDGVGFSIGSSNGQAESNGMGLPVMRYRARLCGGELQVEQALPRGAVISCTACLTQPESHASETTVSS